jgi:hypothetical protein
MPAEPTFNVLLYGGSKTGKTTAACSSPEDVLLVNADVPNASRFARLRYPETWEIEIEGFATLVEIAAGLKDGSLKAKTIVIDTVAELHRRLLEEQSNRAVRPSLPIYGDVSVHIERFCRSLCTTHGVNVVLVCHDQAVKDDASGEFVRKPYTGTSNPALGNKLLSMVDIIAYTGVVEEQDSVRFVGQLLAGKGREGGVRGVPVGVLGKVSDLNLSEWFATIRAAEQAAADLKATSEAKSEVRAQAKQAAAALKAKEAKSTATTRKTAA